MAAVRPFQFTALPRLTKPQAALQQSMAVYLSYAPLRPDFVPSLCDSLQQMVGEPCVLAAPELRAVSRTQLGALLPQVGCLVVLGAAPSEEKIIVDVDPNVAALVIERLLGGKDEPERLQRPPTELEQGVLSYAVLRVLQLFGRGWESGREVALTLDRFASNLDELEDIVGAASGFQSLGYRLQVGRRNGYARVLIPDAMVNQRFGTHVAQSGATPQELAYMRQRLRSLGEREVVARLQVSHVDLQPKDMAHVEAGDIIVLENHQISITADGIEGVIFVTLGNGKNGGFSARLRNDESEAEQARLEIVDIVTREQPLEESMAEDSEGAAQAPAPDDNLPQTEGLLRDVDAPVVVELGRIKMNTAQVVRLRSGQILRLTRGPNDPVDLVVNGKLFARGELIEVEGELGVRLTQVAG